MPTAHGVNLTPAERTRRRARIAGGKAPAAAQRRARLLLMADHGPAGPAWTEARIAEAWIAEALEIDERPVARAPARWAVVGLDGAV